MTTRYVSRRAFLKAAGLTLSAAVLAGAGAGCAAQAPQGARGAAQEVETPSYRYEGEPVSNGRILVAYATRTGSTVGVAAAIGETLSQRGFAVDVKPIKEDLSAESYQAVVLGSAINGGQWLPEAVEYVKNHQQALSQVPVALFCVHIMNLGEDETSQKNRLAYLNNVRELLDPVNEAFFAGMGMDPEKESAIVRWVYRTFKIGGEGDCRDWGKIRGWAQTVEL